MRTALTYCLYCSVKDHSTVTEDVLEVTRIHATTATFSNDIVVLAIVVPRVLRWVLCVVGGGLVKKGGLRKVTGYGGFRKVTGYGGFRKVAGDGGF